MCCVVICIAVEATEIERARAVAEKALKTIHFREQKEKFNVWLALLNLENLYGTAQSLDKAVERAVQFNDPKAVHLQLAKMFEATNKIPRAVETLEKLSKKHYDNPSIWMELVSLHFRRSRPDDGRSVFKSAVEKLPARERIAITTKFAQIEYRLGSVDRARTLLDGVVTHYPKRNDIWSLYADAEMKLLAAAAAKRDAANATVKASATATAVREQKVATEQLNAQISACRNLFERLTAGSFKPKAMKTFFTRYHNFEKQYGTAASAERVLAKVKEYIDGANASKSAAADGGSRSAPVSVDDE